MIDTLLTWQFWAVFLPLITAIWVKVRMTKKQYYRLGTKEGFALGVSHTVQTLLDEHMISYNASETANVDVDKLLDRIVPIIAANLIKEANRKALL